MLFLFVNNNNKISGKYLDDGAKKIKDVISSPTTVTYALVPEASLFEVYFSDEILLI